MSTEPEGIHLDVNGVPPVKQAPFGQNAENRKRRKRLKDEAAMVAKDTNRAYEFYGETPVRIAIRYSRARGKSDAANIVGGIADALEGVFYEDDRQLTCIAYTEEMGKKRDSYTVSLESMTL